MPRTLVSRHGHEVGSVFDLLCTNEAALPAALGLGLAGNPQMLARVTVRLLPGTPEGALTELRMEDRDDAGRTDLEIHFRDRVAVI